MTVEEPHFYARKKIEGKNNEEFQARLSSILEAHLTVENISTFADDALNKLVALTSDVAQKYKEETKSEKTIGELEDDSYTRYGLPNIGELLDRVQKKVDQIKSIEKFINEKSKMVNEVITPPDTFESIPASGERTFEEKRLIPRLTTLLYILETDLNISKDQVSLTQGQVRKEMVRQAPYFRVEIKPLDRVVYVCEEEKNASYVFDAQKLEERSLAFDKLDLMTKEERNELIRQFPDIGRRLIQTKHWRENMSELLSGSIEKTKTVEDKEQKPVIQDSNLPKASSSEFDPWKNFWTDPETGKHYASIFHLAARECFMSRYSIRECLSKINSQTRKIIINNRMVVEAYCLEDLLESPDYQNYVNIPKISRESDEARGLWRNFYTDDEGNHWGSAGAIARKIGMTRKENLYEVVKNFPTKAISYAMNKKCQTYCFEDVLRTDYVKSFIEKIPEPETSGEWKGFWTDQNGKHWAPMAVISARLSLHDEAIKREIAKNNLLGIEMRDLGNRRARAFCYEEIISQEGIKLFIELPKVASDGEWKGFWTDENGKHWANVHNLVAKYNCSANTLNKFIAKNKVASRKLIDLTGRVDDCYCYEGLIDLKEIKEYFSLPQVNKSGEWAGYYVDDKGNHWATEKVFYYKFNLPKSAMSKYLENVTEKLTVRNPNGAKVEVFCLETLEKDIQFRDLIKDYIEGNSVLKTGEWKDFYIDGLGKHWGSERALSEKTDLSSTVIKRIIDILKLTLIKIKASNGIERDGYCYEDIINYSNPDSLLKYKKAINKTDQ
ncbi:MAG: hypothetical protein Q7K35_04890 [bacterium]|nr:hypothetical protein [bacterium]